jgi:hypothetical protein
MSGTWHREWLSRGRSGIHNQQFVWQDDALYVMDNHRAALWCWLRHMVDGQRYSFLHIDRHWDTSDAQLETWLAALPPLEGLTLAEYLAIDYQCGIRVPLIDYGNYITLFFARYADRLDELLFATHDDGTRPLLPVCEKAVWDIPENLDFWIQGPTYSNSSPWIVNLDIDFFFTDANTDNDDDSDELGALEARQCVRMLADDFIASVGRSFARQLASGRIAVLTIALSPEWCGGWAAAERACRVLLDAMGRSMPEVNN